MNELNSFTIKVVLPRALALARGAHHRYTLVMPKDRNNEGHTTGVYATSLKDGTPSYRAMITWHGRRISLGSYPDAALAGTAYADAARILSDPTLMPETPMETPLPLGKRVTLMNLRDRGIYIAQPIYLEKKFFRYYLDEHRVFKFDIDDLFYYSSHRIMARGSHLFVADYGSQLNILNRYGIRSYAVEGRDYVFLNGDPTDLRYENIQIINRYYGVRQVAERGFARYRTYIHIRGDLLVGTYDTESEAAVAYNRAADVLRRRGLERAYPQNYVEELTASEYADIYTSVQISQKLYTISLEGL